MVDREGMAVRDLAIHGRQAGAFVGPLAVAVTALQAEPVGGLPPASDDQLGSIAGTTLWTHVDQFILHYVHLRLGGNLVPVEAGTPATGA